MSDHASLSPSAWERRRDCLGSAEAEAGLPDSTSSYADIGTATHWVIEQVAIERYRGFGSPDAPAAQYLGRTYNCAREGQEPRLVTIDQEMVECAQTFLDYVETRRKIMAHELIGSNGVTRPVPVLVLSELRVSPEWALNTNACDGTADIMLVADHCIEVVDYKHGQGVAVDIAYPGADLPGAGPQRYDPLKLNGQLMLYGLGALGIYPLRANQRVKLTIVQPRAPHPEGPIRSVEIGEPEISAFIAATKATLARIVPGAPRTASDKACRFCRAKPACRTYAEAASQAIGAPTTFDQATFLQEITAFTTRSMDDLSPEELVKIHQGADLFRGLLKAVEEHIHQQLVTGTADAAIAHAFKLVRGRTNRAWAPENEDSLIAALAKIRWKDPVTEKTTGLGRKQIVEEKVRSPAQVETLLKKASKGAELTATHWDAFNRLVTRPEGSLQVVAKTDPRPEVAPRDPATLFGDLPMDPPPAAPSPPPVQAPAQDLFALFN